MTEMSFLSISGHSRLMSTIPFPNTAPRPLLASSSICRTKPSLPHTLKSTSFFGSFPSSSSSRSLPSIRQYHVVTATIKRRKDPSFDKVVDREKKLRIVSKLKDLLVKQPGRVMSLRNLGKYRRQLSLLGKRRFIVLLRKYPAVFKVFEEGAGSIYFRLTREAESQYFEEIQLKKEMEDHLVTKLRKMLMMSVDKRILIEKIKHLKRDLGLPDDFDTDLVNRYPQYFVVVETGMGPALELVLWDPSLAITAQEAKSQVVKEPQEGVDEGVSISGRVPRFPRLPLPRGYTLARKDREKILKFHQLPCISPYEDKSTLDPSSPEAEKHAVKVVQELLSLTLEKKTLVDHLTHFRSDYKFSQRVRAMLIRHPEIFYVSLKGHRDSVFLTEAYKDSELIEKDPLLVAKERLAALVAASNKQKMFDESEDEGEEEESEDDNDDWSDTDEDYKEDFDATKAETSLSSVNVLDEDEEDKRRLQILREAERLSRGQSDVAFSRSGPREKW